MPKNDTSAKMELSANSTGNTAETLLTHRHCQKTRKSRAFAADGCSPIPVLLPEHLSGLQIAAGLHMHRSSLAVALSETTAYLPEIFPLRCKPHPPSYQRTAVSSENRYRQHMKRHPPAPFPETHHTADSSESLGAYCCMMVVIRWAAASVCR